MSREKKILLIIPTSLVMLLVTVSVIIACVGSPQPPVCGNAIFLGKFMTETAVAGVESTIPTGLVPYVSWFVDEEDETRACPAPNFASVTLSFICTPDDGSPAFVIGPQMFTLDTPTTPGFQPLGGTTVPFEVPPGTPPSVCVIEGTYDVTFALPTGGLGFLSDTGDAEIYFVPPSPDDPSLPIVSMEVLTLETDAEKQNNGAGGAFSAYQGDQQLFYLLLENNDLSRSATFNIDGEATQVAGFADGFTTAEDAYTDPTLPNYSIANPSDAFSMELFFDETPGPLANTPGGSKSRGPAGSQVETEVTLGPGEMALVGVAQRIFGACADGSCDENQFSAEVTLTAANAGGTGKAMDEVYHVGTSFVYYTDNSQTPGYPGLTIVDDIKMNPDYDAFWTYTEILDDTDAKIDEMHRSNLLPADRQPNNNFGIRTSGAFPNAPWPPDWRDQITVDGVTFTIGARWQSFGGYGFDGFALRGSTTSITGINPGLGSCATSHITSNEANSNILVEIDASNGCNDNAPVKIDGVDMGTIGELRGNPAYFVDDASCHTLSFPFGNLSDAPVLIADPPLIVYNFDSPDPVTELLRLLDELGTAADFDAELQGPDGLTLNSTSGTGDLFMTFDPSLIDPGLDTREWTLIFTNDAFINSPVEVPILARRRLPPPLLPLEDYEFNSPPLAQVGETYNADIIIHPLDPQPVDPYFNMEFFIGIETNDDIVISLPDLSPFGFTAIDPDTPTDELERLKDKFGEDPVNRCSEGVRKCSTIKFGDGFMFESEVFVDGFVSASPEASAMSLQFIRMFVETAADNSETKRKENLVGVLNEDKKLPVISEEDLKKAIELFNDDTVYDEKTIGLVTERYGIQEPIPPARGTYFFDEFLSFRKDGSQAPVTVDFAGCVPDPGNDLFCGFVFQAAGGGISNLRIENAPDAAIDASADSILVTNNELVDNAVGVLVSAGVGTTIQGNTFSGNGRGIDLGGDGVTANDDGDSDVGPNNLQNFPVLTDALLGGSSTITGTFNSTRDASFSLEFFASEAGDCTGENRNGEMLLGTADVATDATGNAAFTVVLDSTVARMDYVTATATDGGGNTSELSACVQVVTGVATEGPAEVPAQFALDQNYPNPFNPSTRIRYAVPQASPIRLEVFDMLGRLVAVLVDEMKAVGSYEVVFDARGLPSGTYVYRMTGEGFTQTRMLVLLK